MNFTVIFISILLSVICVLITLLQHYYFSYKKVTAVKLYVPLFEDLIPTDDKTQYALNVHQGRHPDESEVLNILHAALESQFSQGATPSVSQRYVNHKGTESEVQNSLQAALACKLSGKTEKAAKLFQHAAAIAPNDPDVLNKFGEFLENDDVISADELYFKALTHSPDHEGALMNRQRTAHVVDQLDLEMFKMIDRKRDMLKDVPDTSTFFQTLKRQAYYLHIFHTAGIEGNTLTIDEVRFLLETRQAVAGKSIIEHNEILGLEAAMTYVKLLTRSATINVHEILGIHRRVMGHVDPLSSGVFRDKQVFVGSHVPPPADDLPGLMEGYVEWLNSEEAQSMHAVRYAALAHYKLVDIHPFSDGNGRTSRLIMNLILLRSGYPPIIILKDHRQKYYEFLNIANKGDVRPFVRFIAQCTEHILNMYLWGSEKYGHLLDSLDLELPTSIVTNEENRNL